MSILGIDYGRKRIGLAISDPNQSMAMGLRIIRVKDMNSAADEIVAIISESRITGVVLGLPKRMDNTLGLSAQEVNTFAELLKTRGVDVPITFWDERLSSKQAAVLLRDTGLRHKAKRDHINITAAQLVLQSYLDSPDKTTHQL